jgi:hypothetical protein
LHDVFRLDFMPKPRRDLVMGDSDQALGISAENIRGRRIIARAQARHE